MALHSTQGIISDSVTKVENKKKSIEYNNFKNDISRAEMRIKERVAGHKKYKEFQNKVQAGYCPDSDEEQKIGELQEKTDEDFAKIRNAEILGRAKRLELEQAAFSGEDPNLVAPPVDGSNSKFENTRLLETLHGKLSDPMLEPAVLGASVLVYGQKGPTIAKVTNASIDITKQQLSKEINSKKKINSAVAVERSEDFQDRVHYYETTEETAGWLADKISGMGGEEHSGSVTPEASVASPKGASLSGDNYSRIYKETNDTP